MRILKAVFGILFVAAGAFVISWIIYAPKADIRGTWATEGYGLYIDMGRTMIDVYEVTEVSCKRSQRIPAHQWLIAAMEDITFTRSGARLEITAGGTLNPIMADQTDGLPGHCPETPTGPGTARDNFDVLWHAMNEHYAFFDLHGVDWEARRDAHHPMTDVVLDDNALLALFKATLDGLDDGHLYVATATGEVHSPSVRPVWHADRHLVRDNTLSQVKDLTGLADTGLFFGWATPDIGYVFMADMDVNDGFNTKAADAASAAFADIASTFAEAKGIILDVRYNPGGRDDIALAYASYFTDAAVPVFSKKTRSGTGHTLPFDVVLQPKTTSHLAQPLIVLTTGYTGSAAEIFTLAMRELPQVTVMGTNTSGGLSDVANFSLPNGWELGLSHQIYTTPSGDLFEGVGIPPDVVVNVDVASARAGMDVTLDTAIELLSR